MLGQIKKGCSFFEQPCFIMSQQKSYFDATFSIQRTIVSITIIAIAQTTANSNQQSHNDQFSYIIAPKTNNKLPTAVALNQSP
jgi:hypothetical protein